MTHRDLERAESPISPKTRGRRTRAGAVPLVMACALAALAGVPGCGGTGGDPIASELAAEQAVQAKTDAATPPPETSGPSDGQPPARSALGKARERAERLKDEVAEYQKKLEKAADGKFD